MERFVALLYSTCAFVDYIPFCFLHINTSLFFNFKLFIVITDIVSSHVLYKSHLLIVFSRNVKYPCMFLFRRSEFSLPNHLPYASKSLLHCFYTLIIIALSGKKQALFFIRKQTSQTAWPVSSQNSTP